ncbi:phage tail protein [Pseudomonas cavernae]|uniref:Phage tail protein n=1 Tax=Pseudomonas cavernae TaxID=2320867 RepID=A0A385Z3J1_9PSED|nr:tape measure protein [Pseudomonas cavernae]AYC32727.1 phage tail protein [Pseudomonas cavernae]
MTDVRLSISLDAEQAKRAAQGFRGDFKALVEQLRKPLGQASTLQQVQGETLAAAQATRNLDGAAARQQIALAALAAQQLRTSTASRQLAAEQRQLRTEAVQTTQAVGRQAQIAGAQAALANRIGSGVGSAIGAYAGVQSIAAIARAADAYTLMNARLKLATSSQEEFNTAQAELARIATATQSPLASLYTLYGRISRPLKEAGRSQADIIKLTESVATAFRVSGASAQEAENGVIQFAQALGAGALRGDEFNSVAEQAPRLMQALAAGIGVPVAALKEMAAQGLLTAGVVTDALTSQLETLRTEAASLPETVGGAMTALSDSINGAVGKTNLQPLIDSLNALRQQVEDPATAEGIGQVTSAIVRLGSVALGAISDLGSLGNQIAVWAAQAAGSITRIDEIDNEIKAIEKTLNGWSVGDILVDMLYSDDELKNKLDALKKERVQLVEQQSGMNAEMKALADAAHAAAEEARQKEVNAQTQYIGELKSLQDRQLKDAETAIKALQAAEKKALADSKKVKDERLAIEQKYAQTIAQLNLPSTSQEPSYASANALKVGAKEALRKGDFETAQRQAEAARQMLLDLQAAGENTYGLSGFAKELQDIELAANDLEQTEADNKLAVIAMNIALLKAQADELKEVKITPTMDEEAVGALVSQMQALAANLGQTLTIPVRMVPYNVEGTDAMNAMALQTPQVNYPGYAIGGLIQGPGSGTSDSILARLSNGEFVMRAAAVQHYGPELLQQFNSLRLPKFAAGGFVGNRLTPSIPAADGVLNAAMHDTPKSLGTVNLTIDGNRLPPLKAEQESFADVLRMARLKHGKTRL